MKRLSPWPQLDGARVVNQTRGTVLAEEARHARSRWQRFIGLMGRVGLPEGHALIFTPCRGVHTHFMRFTIDLVFVEATGDGGGRVVKVHEQMRPFQLDLAGSDLLLELPAGTIARTATAVDDRLGFVAMPGGQRR